MAVRGDRDRRGHEALRGRAPEDLAELDLDLVLLAGDVRNDVVEQLDRARAGNPAPETDCSVVTTTRRTPNARSSGASASASPATEQFGFVTTNPPPPGARGDANDRVGR